MREAKARLREDKVALRVLRDVESSLRVPAGKSVLFTLGAPIKLPKQLVAALVDTLHGYLATGAIEVDEQRTILGNRVRFRVLESKWPAKVLGFVFTGDPAPGDLAGAMRLADAKTLRRIALLLEGTK